MVNFNNKNLICILIITSFICLQSCSKVHIAFDNLDMIFNNPDTLQYICEDSTIFRNTVKGYFGNCSTIKKRGTAEFLKIAKFNEGYEVREHKDVIYSTNFLSSWINNLDLDERYFVLKSFSTKKYLTVVLEYHNGKWKIDSFGPGKTQYPIMTPEGGYLDLFPE